MLVLSFDLCDCARFRLELFLLPVEICTKVSDMKDPSLSNLSDYKKK